MYFIPMTADFKMKIEKRRNPRNVLLLSDFYASNYLQATKDRELISTF